MIRAIRYAGKVYQNELAKSCQALGYQIEASRDPRGTVTGFEIKGVPEDVRTRFSKRRADIERGVKRFEETNGRTPTTAEVHMITVDTRNAKLAEVTTPAVLAAQRAQLTPAELGKLEAVRDKALSSHPDFPTVSRERECLRLAVGHLYERRSVACGHEVLAEALNQHLGEVDLPKLHGAARASGLVALGEKPWAQELFTTHRGLRQERWAVDFIARTKGAFSELGRWDTEKPTPLSIEQSKAVRELLASRDQVVCLRGAAGVGKSTTLKELHQSLTASGSRVHICAPTTSAADTLRRDGMNRATTVAGFLANDARTETLNGAVLIVDEAGLSSNQQGTEILQLAERNQARVIFLGDSRQHTSVEAGDFLRILEAHSPLHRVELTDIRRQTVASYRDAVRHMASGAVKLGLEELDRLGWIHEGRADYLCAAVNDYLRLSHDGQGKSSVLAVTPTWEENHAFTAMLRAELKAKGVLGEGETLMTHENLPWTKAQLGSEKNYAPGLMVTFDRSVGGFRRGEFAEVARVEAGKVWLRGSQGAERPLPLHRGGFSIAKVKPLDVCLGDRLLIRANDRASNLINGQTLAVASVQDGVITTTEGPRIDTRTFKQFTHGFAVTSHRSQSKTTDHVVVAAARMDAKSVYVACSRGRLSCSLHTPDKAALFERLPDGNRAAALDFPKAHAIPAETDREKRWAEVDQPVSTASEDRLRRQAVLSDPWWRGLLKSVAEWGRRVLPGRAVDAAREMETQSINR
jgi:hypothetical protein